MNTYLFLGGPSDGERIETHGQLVYKVLQVAPLVECMAPFELSKEDCRSVITHEYFLSWGSVGPLSGVIYTYKNPWHYRQIAAHLIENY